MAWPFPRVPTRHCYPASSQPGRSAATGDLSWAQTLMAANAPMMIQEAMVNGHPDRGILPSGQVAGIISDQPTVEALIASIVAEADQGYC